MVIAPCATVSSPSPWPGRARHRFISRRFKAQPRKRFFQTPKTSICAQLFFGNAINGSTLQTRSSLCLSLSMLRGRLLVFSSRYSRGSYVTLATLGLPGIVAG